MNDFIDRTEEVAHLLNPPSRMTNLYGETGIGKSRLLEECKLKFEKKGSGSFILIDLENVKNEPGKPEEAVLKQLIRLTASVADTAFQSAEQAAASIVVQLSGQVQTPEKEVFIVLDTAEVFQTERSFWEWMEKNLLRPFILRGKVNLIVSGRLPIAWEDFEIRRVQEFLKIEPLASPRLETAGATIAKESSQAPAEVLARSLLDNVRLPSQTNVDSMIEILVKLSQGHPLLIEKMAEYLAKYGETVSIQSIETELSEKVTYPFIVEHLFEGIQDPWDKLIWWMSVLDHFDSTFLREYLITVAPAEVENKPDYYFIQGINSLRKQSTLIWKEREGERFHGVTGQIIRKCFEYTRRDDYIRANQQAASTYRKLANEFLADEEALKNKYEEIATAYDNRANEVRGKG